MTPTLVHRYSWPIREAIEQLLGDAVGDCEAWRIRIEGDEVVIDVVAPAERLVVTETPSIETPAAPISGEVVDLGEARLKRDWGIDVVFHEDGSPAARFEDEAYAAADAAQSLIKNPKPDVETAEPPRKGGALARQAGIMCGEKGFWTFIGKRFGVTVSSADEAAAWLKADCDVTSRIDFDYDEGKAAKFREIDKTYHLWLEGYD